VAAGIGCHADITAPADVAHPCADVIMQGKVKQIVGSTLKDLPAASSGSQAGGGRQPGEPVVNFESGESSGEFARLYAGTASLGATSSCWGRMTPADRQPLRRLPPLQVPCQLAYRASWHSVPAGMRCQLA